MNKCVHIQLNRSQCVTLRYCLFFFFFTRFIAQTVYTVCTRINYKIVPVTNLNKYLHCGTGGTE